METISRYHSQVLEKLYMQGCCELHINYHPDDFLDAVNVLRCNELLLKMILLNRTPFTVKDNKDNKDIILLVTEDKDAFAYDFNGRKRNYHDNHELLLKGLDR